MIAEDENKKTNKGRSKSTSTASMMKNNSNIYTEFMLYFMQSSYKERK